MSCSTVSAYMYITDIQYNLIVTVSETNVKMSTFVSKSYYKDSSEREAS
jgi:hypothetical protein